MMLVNLTTGRTAVHELAVADRFWPRLLGLQFRRSLPAGHGLLLVPCGSVHTMWLRFPLDLAMLGDGGSVLAVRRALRPWRGALAPRSTRAVVEVAGGTLDANVGDRLSVIGADDRASLRFFGAPPKVVRTS